MAPRVSIVAAVGIDVFHGDVSVPDLIELGRVEVRRSLENELLGELDKLRRSNCAGIGKFRWVDTRGSQNGHEQAHVLGPELIAQPVEHPAQIEVAAVDRPHAVTTVAVEMTETVVAIWVLVPVGAVEQTEFPVGHGIRRAQRDVRVGQVLGVDGGHLRPEIKRGTIFAGLGRHIVAQLHFGEHLPLGFVGVHLEDQRPLFEVALATRAPCGFASAGERGKQDRRQNPDDGDNNKQLNQSESSSVHDSISFLHDRGLTALHAAIHTLPLARTCVPLSRSLRHCYTMPQQLDNLRLRAISSRDPLSSYRFLPRLSTETEHKRSREDPTRPIQLRAC